MTASCHDPVAAQFLSAVQRSVGTFKRSARGGLVAVHDGQSDAYRDANFLSVCQQRRRCNGSTQATRQALRGGQVGTGQDDGKLFATKPPDGVYHADLPLLGLDGCRSCTGVDPPN